MPGKRLMVVLQVLALVGLFLLAACAPESAAPAIEPTVANQTIAPQATVLIVATPAPTNTPPPKSNAVIIGSTPMTGKHYNPIWLSSAPQFLTFPLILPALTWFDDRAQPVLNLATKVDVAQNAMAYTFTLPKEARWSDGTPLTTKDVAFTYKLALDPAVGSALWATNLAGVKGALDYQRGAAKDIEGIKIVDEQTIRFELREANAMFLFNTYLGILPAHLLDKVDPKEIEKQAYVDAPVVTAGPYEFVKYEPGQSIQLKKKANYWGKPVNIEQITVRLFDANASIVSALEAGQLDVAALPLSDVERFRKNIQFDVLSTKGLGAYVLHVDARTREQIAGLNRSKEQGGRGYTISRTPKPYLADRRFRQALDYALDQKAILQAVVNGEAVPISSPILAPDWAVNPNLNKYDQDLDRAKTLMTEAGIKFDAQGIALSENRQITLVYLAVASDESRQLGDVLQQQLAKVGIRVESKLVSESGFLQAAINGEGDLIRNVATRQGADPSVAALYYTCKAGWAELVMGYCNTRFDDALAKAAATTKSEDRQKLYWDASAILNGDLPSIFLFAPNAVVGVRKGLGGVKPTADPNYVTWNIQDWVWPK